MIKDKFQKGGRYRDILPETVLSDICKRLTGRTDFRVSFDEDGYNVGRLVLLEHEDTRYYVSVSETTIRSRNASFQSFPSALTRYVLDPSASKRICFYVHPDASGNFSTDYFMFMYRLMKTVGTEFLNIDEFISTPVVSFASPEDLMSAKGRLRGAAPGNNSTYVTRGEAGQVQVYGKTYGANKYETTLLCLALTAICHTALEIYEVGEGGLTALPSISREAILASGAVTISTSTAVREAEEFSRNDSLRSVRYIYNLLERYSSKKCALCACEIPQIIHGAHIWPVASIKNHPDLTFDEKLRYALDGCNGLWLCQNHHSLFDAGILYISDSGVVKHDRSLAKSHVDFLTAATTVRQLPTSILEPPFIEFLRRRNDGIVEAEYIAIKNPSLALH